MKLPSSFELNVVRISRCQIKKYFLNLTISGEHILNLNLIIQGFSIFLAVVLGSAAHAEPINGQGFWETTLLARDIDGDGVTDAFYDTDLNITWLRNANANGGMDWDGANNWTNNLVFGGIDGWRLPTALNQDGSGPCAAANCSGSEMGHLWYVELGNIADPAPSFIANTGDFQNLEIYAYWSGTEYSPFTQMAWYFDNRNGGQWMNWKTIPVVFAMAVHNGDVGTATPLPIPEPETYSMMLAGFGLLSFMRRRKQQSA